MQIKYDTCVRACERGKTLKPFYSASNGVFGYPLWGEKMSTYEPKTGTL